MSSLADSSLLPAGTSAGHPSAANAYRQMILASLLWGTIGPTAELIHRHTALSPLQTSFWRLAIAALPLAMFAVLVARRGARPGRRDVAHGLVIGLLTSLSQLSYFSAIASSGIAIPTLIATGLGPILTAIGQTVVFGTPPDRRTLVALPTALVGLALLVLDGPGQVTTTGVLLSFAAALTYAAATLAAGPASRRMDVRVLNACAVAGGVLTLVPFVAFAGGPGTPGSAVGWLGLGHLGLVVSGLAYGLYFSSARTLPSTHICILSLLEPLAATILAAAVFGEALTIGAVAGGVLMFAAVGAISPRREAEPLAATI